MESVLCPAGKWQLVCDAATTLGVGEKQFKREAANGNLRIYRENGRKAHVAAPYDYHWFYYVSNENTNANSEKTLTLNEWVVMCKVLSAFMDNPVALPPAPAINVLQKYSGVDCNNYSPSDLESLVEKLRLEKAVLLPYDVPEKESTPKGGAAAGVGSSNAKSKNNSLSKYSTPGVARLFVSTKREQRTAVPRMDALSHFARNSKLSLFPRSEHKKQ